MFSARLMMMMIRSTAIFLVLSFASYKCENEYHSANLLKPKVTENSRAAVQSFSEEKNGPLQHLKRGDVGSNMKHVPIRKQLEKTPRNNYDYLFQPQDTVKPSKIKPGQFAGKYLEIL